MPIEKSESYKTDLASRKLFGRLHTDISALAGKLDALMTAANAMRLAIGTATLTLAEVEALHVAQSHAKRTNDAILFEAQARLGDMLEVAKLGTDAVKATVSKQAPQVQALLTQANRINERDVVDNELNGPLPGVDYVDTSYFSETLHCSKSHVRNLIAKGIIPKHDALETEGDSDRPKHLWLKHIAVLIVQRIRNTPTGPSKKGVAALI